MKKFLLALLFIALFVSSSFAASQSHRVGIIVKLNSDAKQFSNFFDLETYSRVSMGDPELKFYSSINAMQLALKAGEIDEILLSEPVVNYMLANNPDYIINCIVLLGKNYPSLVFGFNANNTELRDEVNRALAEMRNDGTLVILKEQYSEFDKSLMNPPAPVKFTKFDGAKTIKVAVTGDLPPLDYTAADGTPEGYNVAMLAEISRRLKFNVEFLNIDSSARAVALTSGRADMVFWLEFYNGLETQPDIPSEIIVSEPYFHLNKLFHVKLK